MTRPPLDPEEMRRLAAAVSRASSEARRKLKFFVAGNCTARDALPVFREVLRDLLFTDTTVLSKTLRADLNAWASIHGTGRETREEATTKPVATRYTATELDDIDAAAAMHGLKRSEYIRQAVNLATQRDLGKAQNADVA